MREDYKKLMNDAFQDKETTDADIQDIWAKLNAVCGPQGCNSVQSSTASNPLNGNPFNGLYMTGMIPVNLLTVGASQTFNVPAAQPTFAVGSKGLTETDVNANIVSSAGGVLTPLPLLRRHTNLLKGGTLPGATDFIATRCVAIYGDIWAQDQALGNPIQYTGSTPLAVKPITRDLLGAISSSMSLVIQLGENGARVVPPPFRLWNPGFSGQGNYQNMPFASQLALGYTFNRGIRFMTQFGGNQNTVFANMDSPVSVPGDTGTIYAAPIPGPPMIPNFWIPLTILFGGYWAKPCPDNVCEF